MQLVYIRELIWSARSRCSSMGQRLQCVEP